MSLRFFDPEGNEVDADNWASTLTAYAVKQTLENFKLMAISNVSRLVCTTHGGKAELTFDVTNFPDAPQIGIKATACCDEFAEQAIQMAYDSWATE